MVSQLVRPHLPARQFASPAFDQLEHPGQLLSELLFTGYYPCVPWLAYLLLGMALGRVDLASRVVAIRLVISGLAVAVVAFVVSRSFTEQPWVLRRLVPEAASYGDVSTVRRSSTRSPAGCTAPRRPVGRGRGCSWWRRTAGRRSTCSRTAPAPPP